jgi:CRP/FNR family cyclic AMP-dependent transcriptional regulator
MSFTGVLRQADVFFELTPSQLADVAAVGIERRYGIGEVVFEENSACDELYVIAQGEVEILVDPSLVSERSTAVRQLTTIATLRRGQSFGEVALVDQGLRSATARSASHDTHLVALPREELMRLCESDPLLGFRLMRNLAADLAMKIRNTDLMIREKLLYARRASLSGAD